MAPMNSLFSHLLHFFHLDEPGDGSSDNGPLENLLERLEDFFQRLAEHFFHPHPCPPDHPSGDSQGTSNPAASPGDNADTGPSGSHPSDDGTPGNDESGPVSHPAWDHRWPGSNPDWLRQCNLPGFGTNRDHAGDEPSSPQSERDGVLSDQLGSNLTQLVQAMASHIGGSGFDAGSSSHINADPAPQSAIAAAWNQ